MLHRAAPADVVRVIATGALGHVIGFQRSGEPVRVLPFAGGLTAFGAAELEPFEAQRAAERLIRRSYVVQP